MTALEPKYGYCGACGEPVHNKGAHAEACTGTTVRFACRVLVPGGGFGTRYECSLPVGHPGPHRR